MLPRPGDFDFEILGQTGRSPDFRGDQTYELREVDLNSPTEADRNNEIIPQDEQKLQMRTQKFHH
jgi:hypothetical protein